jgi:hypothetical protein
LVRLWFWIVPWQTIATKYLVKLQSVMEIGEGKVIKNNKKESRLPVSRLNFHRSFTLRQFHQTRTRPFELTITDGRLEKSRNWFQRNRLETFNCVPDFSEDVNRNDGRQFDQPIIWEKTNFNETTNEFKFQTNLILIVWQMKFGIFKWCQMIFYKRYNLNNHSFMISWNLM